MHIADWWRTLTEAAGVGRVMPESSGVPMDSVSLWPAVERQRRSKTPADVAADTLSETVSQGSHEQPAAQRDEQEERERAAMESRRGPGGDAAPRMLQLDAAVAVVLQWPLKLAVHVAGVEECPTCPGGDELMLARWRKPPPVEDLTETSDERVRALERRVGAKGKKTLTAIATLPTRPNATSPLTVVANNCLPTASCYLFDVNLYLFDLEQDPIEMAPIAEAVAPGDSADLWLAALFDGDTLGSQGKVSRFFLLHWYTCTHMRVSLSLSLLQLTGCRLRPRLCLQRQC